MTNPNKFTSDAQPESPDPIQSFNGDPHKIVAHRLKTIVGLLTVAIQQTGYPIHAVIHLLETLYRWLGTGTMPMLIPNHRSDMNDLADIAKQIISSADFSQENLSNDDREKLNKLVQSMIPDQDVQRDASLEVLDYGWFLSMLQLGTLQTPGALPNLASLNTCGDGIVNFPEIAKLNEIPIKDDNCPVIKTKTANFADSLGYTLLDRIGSFLSEYAIPSSTAIQKTKDGKFACHTAGFILLIDPNYDPSLASRQDLLDATFDPAENVASTLIDIQQMDDAGEVFDTMAEVVGVTNMKASDYLRLLTAGKMHLATLTHAETKNENYRPGMHLESKFRYEELTGYYGDFVCPPLSADNMQPGEVMKATDFVRTQIVVNTQAINEKKGE